MTSNTTTKLNILPVDVAENMKKCSNAAAQSTANERFGTKGEAGAQKIYWTEFAAAFTEKAKGLLSKEICYEVQHMFWYQAWRTANERKGYKNDVKEDIKKVKEYIGTIKGRGEITDELADQIERMGGYMAWYWSNTLYGYEDDARRDEATYEAAYNKIHGEVKLVDMKFFTDNAKILQQEPKVVDEQYLRNVTDTMQSMSFQFQTARGSTSTISSTVGFEYGVSHNLEVGFEGVGKYSVGVSFKLSSSETISQSLSKSESKTYTFNLQVPAHTVYKAKGVVHEATMNVPYELVFDFKGGRRSITGEWKGVAVSKAEYIVEKS